MTNPTTTTSPGPVEPQRAVTQAETNEAWEKWMAFLREEGREKAYGMLEDHDSPERRCCIGHGCVAVGANRSIEPNEHGNDHVLYEGQSACFATSMCKLFNCSPCVDFKERVKIDAMYVNTENLESFAKNDFLFTDAAQLNDNTTLRPGQIADILEREWKAGNIRGFDEKPAHDWD